VRRVPRSGGPWPRFLCQPSRKPRISGGTPPFEAVPAVVRPRPGGRKSGPACRGISFPPGYSPALGTSTLCNGGPRHLVSTRTTRRPPPAGSKSVGRDPQAGHNPDGASGAEVRCRRSPLPAPARLWSNRLASIRRIRAGHLNTGVVRGDGFPHGNGKSQQSYRGASGPYSAGHYFRIGLARMRR